MSDETDRLVEQATPKVEVFPPSGTYGKVGMHLIRPAERNPRRGQVAAVVESLLEFGQHRPVVVQRQTGQVVVGNHLYQAAQSLGWKEIDAYFVDDDDNLALRRAIADNAVGDKAGWDKAELAEVLKETGPLPGFNEEDVQKIIDQIDKKDNRNPEEGVVFPIVPRFMEKYDYVVVVATNETDSAWLQTRFEARKEASYQDTGVGRSHVITVERARDILGDG